MNDAYADLKKLRHVRVDGNAALEYLAEHVDALVYELQLKKQKLEHLQASYTALNQVRLYFQNDYRDVELDRFRRSLNETISEASTHADRATAATVRELFDNAVSHCIESGHLYETSRKDATQWLELAATARVSAKHYYCTLNGAHHNPHQ
ncbi:hypothetical protein QMT40_002107 [Parvibaculaceae bacterium PLY_AMNH_Bact1]|nr:hypothetical protein QMT40_002107 [Parvibaculaceae bacterium PLY_AMNH_Bact1]